MQGKEAIPEAVDHVQVAIDPRSDLSWLQNYPVIPDDNAHKYDQTGPQMTSAENWSEGVKRLKPRILQRIIDQHGSAALAKLDRSFDRHRSHDKGEMIPN